MLQRRIESGGGVRHVRLRTYGRLCQAGRGARYGPPLLRRTPAPRFGGGYPGRPPRWGGVPPRYYPPVVGGGAVGGGTIGGNNANSRDNGNNNNGRGATPVAQGDQTFVPNEVITAFEPNTTPQAIDQFARRYDLTQVETQNFPLIGTSLYRWRVGGGRSVASVVQALGSENIVASVQPNYIYTLQQAAAAPSGTPGRRGAIRSGRTANRASAPDRNRTKCSGRRDRFGN